MSLLTRFSYRVNSSSRLPRPSNWLKTPLESSKRGFTSLSKPHFSSRLSSFNTIEQCQLIRVKYNWSPKRCYNTKTESAGFHANPFENDLAGYQKALSQTMHELAEKTEELEALNFPGFDTTEKDGVFELHLGEKGTYVLNKQGPNRQIWWSSPLSGPKRYNYDIHAKAWRNTRDGHFMYDLLNEELSHLLNIEFDIYTVAPKPKL